MPSTTKLNERTRYVALPPRGRKTRAASQMRTVWAARSKPVGTNRNSSANEYICTIERNQNGKYSVRVRASFGVGPHSGGSRRARSGQNGSAWSLPVYFLASSFSAAMKKLEVSLQLLQKNEERLRFWGVERSDDPNLAGDLLRDSGLRLDRRREFPAKAAELRIPRERAVPASMLAPVRKALADSVAQERPVYDRAALASD
jgi:hypothetical protein